MSQAFAQLQQALKRLPGLGHRSAERLALHLLVEQPKAADHLLQVLAAAREAINSCAECGNLCEGDRCDICTDPARNRRIVCFVESIPDLRAMERAGAYRGLYHVLHGKLSPIHGIGPDKLNFAGLAQRLLQHRFDEAILALGNDIEGEATCHFIQENFLQPAGLRSSRIGFGLPAGGGIPYADATTLRSALDGRRAFAQP